MAALAGEFLHQESTSAPAPGPRVAGHVVLGDGKPDEGRQLLGLVEVDIGGVGQVATVERHHALIALGIGAAVDGHGQMASAKQLGLPVFAEARCGDALG